MFIDINTLRLISELEYIIGEECYNPNSYDGWNDIEGCDFRYPVHAIDSEGTSWKVRGKVHTSLNVNDTSSKQTVHSMKYKFGSNELYIGIGIKKLLEFLEERYDIDFNDLEDDYQYSLEDD